MLRELLEEFETKIDILFEGYQIELTPQQQKELSYLNELPRDFASKLAYIWKSKYGERDVHRGGFADWARSVIQQSNLIDKQEASNDIQKIKSRWQIVGDLDESSDAMDSFKKGFSQGNKRRNVKSESMTAGGTGAGSVGGAAFENNAIDEGFKDEVKRVAGNAKKSFDKAFWWDGYETPEEIQVKISSMDDKMLMKIAKGAGEKPELNKQNAFKQKLVNRELKKRFGVKPGTSKNESMTAGGTGAGSVGGAVAPMGKMRKRTEEADYANSGPGLKKNKTPPHATMKTPPKTYLGKADKKVGG